MWKNNVIFVFFFMSFALPTVAWFDGSQEHKDFSQSKVHGFQKTDFEDLTKRQKAKVFKIILEHSEQRKELRMTVIDAKQKLVEEVFGNPSKEDLKRAIQKVAEAKNEMTIFRVDVLREVTAVLPQNVADKLRGRIQERLSGRYHHNKTMRL
jgi:hypothetical protein